MSETGTAGPKQIRCLVVDDHPIVREGTAATLELYDDIAVVGKGRNGREAVSLFRELRPDVVLMDLNMPEMGGVEAIEAIRAQAPDARVIILTTYDGDEDIYRGLKAGAKAYLLKEGDVEELVDTVRAVARGLVRIPQEVAAKLAQRMTSPELTPRETEVLRLIASGKTNGEIAGVLSVTEATVKAHVTGILQKLDVSDRTQAVMTALRRGILHLGGGA